MQIKYKTSISTNITPTDMENLEDYFIQILNEHRSVDVADSEFKKIIGEDSELHKLYREWCHEYGHTERNGFREFCEEYRDNEDTVWDSLTDYDE